MRPLIVFCIFFIICGTGSANVPKNHNNTLPVNKPGILTGLTEPATSEDTSVSRLVQRSMIWSPSVMPKQQSYVAFRKTFTLNDSPETARLNIFADSRYILWVNGRNILRGPCRFSPKRPEYDTANIASYLHKGSNTIAVLAHNYFGAINGRIMSHAPGFTMTLDVPGNKLILTDTTWSCNPHTRYLLSPDSWNSVPDIIDGRLNDGEWMATDFDDSSWEKAVAVDGNQWGPMHPRSIPLPVETVITDMKIMPSGKLLSGQLPLEIKGGSEIILDLGRMLMSYADVDLEADLGSVLHITYSLRFVNGQPEEHYYNKAAIYTTRSGRQNFTMGDVWGGRYMTIRCDTGLIILHGFKVTDRRYPFTRIGSFKCSDNIISQLWDNSIYTIETPVEDAYGVDARERGEWLQDPAQPNYLPTRIALAGPGEKGKLVYSDPRLLKNLLLRATFAQRPDGQLEATFPTDRQTDCHVIIEDYSCQWVEALRIYFEATGDKPFVREMFPAMTRLMKWFWDHRTANGLVLAREYTSFDNPLAYITCEGATLNSFFYQALCDVASLSLAIGEKEKADYFRKQSAELAEAFNEHLWNPTENAYNSAIYKGRILNPTSHAQIIALDRGIVPAERIEKVRKWFLANYKNPGSFHVCENKDFESMIANKAGINIPVSYYWVFNELYRMNTPQMDQEVINEIRRRWTRMVTERKDAGTVSEFFPDVESGAESCHNYGAVTAYFLSSYVLGVRLNGPVWQKSLLIEPRLGDLQYAEGVVCTEFGPVKVSWKMTGGSLSFSFTVPEGIKAIVRLPCVSGKPELTINGKLRKDMTIEGRFVVVNIDGGSYTGTVAGRESDIPAKKKQAVRNDEVNKLVTMADSQGNLLLRLNYDGRCMIDRVVVRGQDVISSATGVCSSIRIGPDEVSTRQLATSPKITVTQNTVTASGIRFGTGGIDIEETWTFKIQPERIIWRIARKYIKGGTLDDSGFPGFNFTSHQTWNGALLGTGGVAWFKLFDTQDATYVVHTGPVTFWNSDNGSCLRIVPETSENRNVAVRFSRQPNGTLSFNYYVTDQELGLRQGQYRFSNKSHDLFSPFNVAAGETAVEYTLESLDYAGAYDRGVFKGVDGEAVREICNTIARLGVIDKNIIGSNGWYSGYAVLQEQWLAQMGLAIDDPAYFQAYSETLDYQRMNAIGSDGRVKSRWAYGPWDAIPGTYDQFGFYECQWGYMLDSQPDWVINVAEQFDFTGDLTWVLRQKAACEQVLDYMLRRDSNNNGLVEVMTKSHNEKKGCDWLDVVWASFEPATINAQMYQALVLWSDVEEELGDHVLATTYRDHAARLKVAFNRTTDEGGFWSPGKQCYVHWRDQDGSVHGDNLVLPVNFMAIAYGICDDSQRRDAILRQIEEQMQKEKLFFWPACIWSYSQDEGLEVNWPFPSYENGDIFLAWGELGSRAYVKYDPAIAVRCIKNVLDKYRNDGLAFQRYLRGSQKGSGDDILANMSSPVVGLYRNIYGIQPKWNRLYLEPHLTSELSGTKLRYWLRGQWYTIELGMESQKITVGDFTLTDNNPMALNVRGDTMEYFCGECKRPSMILQRSAATPVELHIDTWTGTGDGARKWTEICDKGNITTSHMVYGLLSNTGYKIFLNGTPAGSIISNTDGIGRFEVKLSNLQPQVIELIRS